MVEGTVDRLRALLAQTELVPIVAKLSNRLDSSEIVWAGHSNDPGRAVGSYLEGRIGRPHSTFVSIWPTDIDATLSRLASIHRIEQYSIVFQDAVYCVYFGTDGRLLSCVHFGGPSGTIESWSHHGEQ
jgi:hypothetical protein